MASEIFDRIATLGESLATLPERTAIIAGALVLKAARETARERKTPSGDAWKRTVDGRTPLQGAAAAITCKVHGTRIRLAIGGAGNERYVFHDYGAGGAGGSSTTREAERFRERTRRRREATGVKSKFHAPRRQILPNPDDQVPEGIVRALREAAERAFGGKR